MPSETPKNAPNLFKDLVDIMRQLRTPKTGCPWDLEQDFASIAPYTIEEAYEVDEAIKSGDMGELCSELGDLLLQVVFHAQMADELEEFSISDVIEAINTKMIRRHPHVFQPGFQERSADEQTQAWEALKAQERAEKDAKTGADISALSGVATALPALMRAEKLQKRAARTGFDWTDPADIFAKLEEETLEVKDAMRRENADDIEDEIGDLLFVCANLARRLKVDPEVALRRANDKFEQRFRAMEALTKSEGVAFDTLDINAQEALWQRVKAARKTAAL